MTMSNPFRHLGFFFVAFILTVSGCATLTPILPPTPATPVAPAKSDIMPDPDKTAVISNEEPAARQVIAGQVAYYYSIAVLMKRNADMDGAMAAMEKAVEADAESAYLTAELISFYLEAQRIESARSFGEAALAKFPTDTTIRTIMGGLYYASGNFDRAIEQYRTVIDLDPENQVAYLYLASVYTQVKEPRRAEETLHRLLAIDGRNIMGLYYLAKLSADAGRLQEAEISLKKALDVRPDFEAAAFDLGALYDKQGQTDQAVAVYREFLTLNPARVNLSLRIADVLIKAKRHDEAEQELLRALSVDPDYLEGRVALGLLYHDREKWEEAADQFAYVLSRTDQAGHILYLMANTLGKMGHWRQAADHYLQVLPTYDLYMNARMSAAMILKDHSQLDEAVSVMREGVFERPDDQVLYLYLSTLLEDRKDNTQAEIVLKDALERFPESPEVLYALGMFYEKTDRSDEAIQTVRIILEKDPDHADALNFIGYVYADRGIHLDEAHEMIVRALGIKPDSGYIIDSLGWVYYRKGDYSNALKHLRRAAKLLPDEPDIWEHLGDVYVTLRRPKDARKAYERALEIRPDNEVIQQKLDGTHQKP